MYTTDQNKVVSKREGERNGTHALQEPGGSRRLDKVKRADQSVSKLPTKHHILDENGITRKLNTSKE